jgi:hypothetical protein
MRIALALVIAILTFDYAVAAVLSESELKKKIVGKTCEWTNGKLKGTSVYSADGAAKVVDNKKNNLVGTWQIKGNELCDKYKKREHGREVCFTFDETSPGAYKGSIGFTATCN